jgi:hypothetical protein
MSPDLRELLAVLARHRLELRDLCACLPGGPGRDALASTLNRQSMVVDLILKDLHETTHGKTKRAPRRGA